MKRPLFAIAALIHFSVPAMAQIDWLGIHLEQQRWNNLQNHQQRMVTGGERPGADDPAVDRALVPDGEAFIVLRRDRQTGQFEELDSRVVPLLPEEGCWHWALHFQDAPETVVLMETLTLPGPAENWKVSADSVVSEDRQAVTTTMELTPNADGIVEKTWCVAEGDPEGQYGLTLESAGERIATFDFAVRAPD